MVNSFDIKIGVAESSEVAQLVQLHLASFRAETHVPVIFGVDYIHAMYKWLVSSTMSYVLVAYHEGKLIGFVAVCDGSFTKPMFIACLPALLKSIIGNPKILFSRVVWERFFRRSTIVNEQMYKGEVLNSAQMTIAAIDRDYRGQGIFGKLINEVLNESSNRGSWAIRAGVYKNNKSSRRVFEKQGWIQLMESNNTIFYYKELINL